MNRFYFPLIVLIFTTFSIHLFGQKDFLEGYIISNQNDTTFGLIEYGINSNFHECNFKKSDANSLQQFKPGEIQAYSFLSSNRYFISKQLPLGDSSSFVFAEALVDGIANLYFYAGEIEAAYFIEKENGEIYPLISKTKRITIDYMKYDVDDNKHVGVLQYVFSDCNNDVLKTQINNSELSHKSLINLTEKYHNYTCSSEDECGCIWRVYKL